MLKKNGSMQILLFSLLMDENIQIEMQNMASAFLCFLKKKLRVLMNLGWTCLSILNIMKNVRVVDSLSSELLKSARAVESIENRFRELYTSLQNEMMISMMNN